jgi:RimJ/RimL family protein N-acetyltransferase
MSTAVVAGLSRSICTERLIIRHCFDELEVHRITANCFLDNEASWRLMERVGMRRELHAVRDSLHRSGRWLDTVGYALLREEVADSPEA